jgi:hypothetical protein
MADSCRMRRPFYNKIAIGARCVTGGSYLWTASVSSARQQWESDAARRRLLRLA